VSLLEDGRAPGLSGTGLEFVLHDLCHLEKFGDPAEHMGQVGFFAVVLRATQRPQWYAFTSRFDDAWEKDFEHVVADMNGSAIFLFAALKMKLKMAVRRAFARTEGRGAATDGPLSGGEARAYADHEAMLLDLLGLHGQVRDAARTVTTKRDARSAAEELHRHFELLARARVHRPEEVPWVALPA
jgi:hypothetical protein